MTFLSEHWRPGSKGVFDWRLIPCHKKYNTYILICQVGNFAKNKAMYLNQAIVYFNFLHFKKQVLDASCSDENRVTLSRIDIGKPLVYFGTNITHQTLTSLRNVANILSPFYNYQNQTCCLNVVQLTTSKSVMSVTAVSMDKGQMQTNLYRCTKSCIAVLNGCFSVIKLQSNAMTAIDQGNITNPAILALVRLLQHHHVCHVYMLDGSDKHSYVTHHPWCHGNLSAVVNMEQPHSIITDTVCGPWQVMCDNSQCMSDWVRGEGLHQCSSNGTLRPHVFVCDSSSILSIPWYRVCDSVTDCSDMSDENLCNKESLTKPLIVPHKDTIQTPKKVEPAFHCKFTERVLPLDYVEDFLPDCYSSKHLLEGVIADEHFISPSFDIEQSLNISNSVLETLSPDIISKMPILQIFDCRGCHIKLIDLSFIKPSLKRLVLLNAVVDKLQGQINDKLNFTLETNIGYLCCMFPNTTCVAAPLPSCLCSNEFPEKTFRNELVCPLIVTLASLVTVIIRIWKRIVVERAQIAVNILGILFNISILMAGFQGFIFQHYDVHQTGGNKHVYCIIISALQYLSVTAVYPLYILDLYCIYMIFTGTSGLTVIEKFKSGTYSICWIALMSIIVLIVYTLFIAYLKIVPDLSQMCSLYFPPTAKNLYHSVLFRIQDAVVITTITVCIAMYLKLKWQISHSEQVFLTAEMYRTSAFGYQALATKHFVWKGFIPASLGVLFSACMLAESPVPADSEYYIVMLAMPIWNMCHLISAAGGHVKYKK